MDVEILKRGDILVLYRTSDFNKIAEYSSVVTSICVVEEVKIRALLLLLMIFSICMSIQCV